MSLQCLLQKLFQVVVFMVNKHKEHLIDKSELGVS